MPFICKIRVIFFDRDDDTETATNLGTKPSIFLKFAFYMFIFFVPGTLDLNTYTVTAINGKDFYSSIKKAYNVLRRNQAKYLVTNVVSFLY